MAEEPIRLTRKELYDRVWSEAMATLAPKLGLSDVGLAKMCKRMLIPVPGRGYWAKKQAGYKVRQTPLPKPPATARASMLETTIRPQQVNESGEIETGPVWDQERFEALPENRIHVAETLDNPHPLVAQTIKALRGAKAESGSHLAPKSSCLAVRVTLGSADRAMRIMDALINALAHRDMKVSIRRAEEQQSPRTVVHLGDDEVQIAIEERFDRIPHVPTLRDKRLLSFQIPKHDYTPSGHLALRIEHGLPDRARTTWGDGKHQRVEDHLNAFIVGIVRAAELQRKQRIEWEERHRQWELQQERERLEARRREIEASRARALNHAVDGWSQAREIRSFLEAVRRAALETETPVEDTPLGRWLTWAEGRANRLDPLHPRPAVPRDPEPKQFWAGEGMRTTEHELFASAEEI
jgi:hypothetical protein